MMSDYKIFGNIAVLMAMIIGLAVVGYQTIVHQPVDLFFSSLVTVILGKYVQQLGFTQGVESTNATAKNVADSIVSTNPTLNTVPANGKSTETVNGVKTGAP